VLLDRGRPSRRDGSRGYTLVEVLVVVIVIGIAVAITVENLNGMHTRFELEGSARELRAFLQSAPGWSKEEHRTVFLRWDPPNRVVEIARDAAGSDVIEQFPLPRFLVVTPGTLTTFSCDPMGRTYPGTSTVMLTTPQVFSATHETMVAGRVDPHITYDMTLTPLWNVTVRKRLQ
jgi:prepilin-type N-terminal cleavage/methylation domain-containing protein